MPRYYFHIHDGHSIIDKDGMVLADTSEARRKAIRISGQYLDNDADVVSLGEEWRMEVTDERGLILFRLDFVVTDAASVGGSFKG
ncbi:MULTISPECIES: DUF6894 family protein [Methylorubrum]|uniref:DUF6894 domain-containing protein n=1 Tax=Methylorubrum suomiense TaxID=144191 RepID=A0ABQ4UXS1_9HYPH|nr:MULTISPECIES: hypothetical protein [Methylobacteriaceae]GJE77007.1 hypothetical protein BGCPKDLD_3607 [Methylorubrum suomiense]